MNADWIDVLPRWLDSGPVELVTVAHVEGSAPREAGTTFLVSANATYGTIGGGHLEFEAIRHARERLAGARPLEVQRYALGPSLGQCCGGVVWLLFESIGVSDRPAWSSRARRWREGESLTRQSGDSAKPSAWTLGDDPESVQFELRGDQWRYRQSQLRDAFPIHVFGAGHVGEAIVRALAPISSDIVWIDSREEAFPAAVPGGVETRWSDDPVDEVDAAPPNAHFLVLTHSHDLDLAICARILAREDFAFFGLIGSKSKRARFEHRLTARGLDCTRMTCPIGIDGIVGKAPAIIAVAVAAQLLQLREARLQSAPADALELLR